MSYSNYQSIFSDTLATFPLDVNCIPRPTDDSMDLQRRVTVTYRKLLRTRPSQRRKQLSYVYYLGELLEEYPEERRISRRKISTYYYRAAIKVYNIFSDIGGTDQIARSISTTVSMVAGLSNEDYQALL